MRTNLLTAFVVAATMVAPAVASADAADSLVGRYEVTFEQVTSNCQSGGLTLGKGTLVVGKQAPGIVATLDKVPPMTGKVARAGRLKAASPLGKTSIAGQEGKFSIAGTVDDTGKLDAVFVAEFYAAGKPLCTQSWSVAGTRSAAAPRAQATDALAPAPALESAAFGTFARFGLPPLE